MGRVGMREGAVQQLKLGPLLVESFKLLLGEELQNIVIITEFLRCPLF
jgi:hypothetical protein